MTGAFAAMRRALHEVLQVGRGPVRHPDPPVTAGYSVVRRALAGVLGVRLRPMPPKVRDLATPPTVAPAAVLTLALEAAQGEERRWTGAEPDTSAALHRLAFVVLTLRSMHQIHDSEIHDSQLAPAIAPAVTSAVTSAFGPAFTSALASADNLDIRVRTGDLDRADFRTSELFRDLLLAVALTRDLALDLKPGSDVTHTLALDLTLARSQVLDRLVDRDLGLDLAVASALGREPVGPDQTLRAVNHALQRALDRAAGLTFDGEDAGDLVGDLTLVRALVRALVMLSSGAAQVRDLIEVFAGVRLDASGVNLSLLRFPDLEVLAGVVWSEATVWPKDVGELIRERSEEIGAGVWRIRGGSERESATLVSR